MNTIISLFLALPQFVATHARAYLFVGLAVALVGAVGLAWHRMRTVRPASGALGDYEPKHAVSAGYDGEGVYAWSCTCGAGQSDYQGLEDATIFGAIHLDDMGEIPAAAS